MAASRIIVVGGGAIGCSIAYHLAGAGKEVLLLERATIAAEASGAAAGMLAPIAEAAEEGPFFGLAVAGLRAFQEDAAAIESVSGMRVDYMPTGIVHTATAVESVGSLQARVDFARSAGLPVRWLGGPEVRRLVPALAGSVLGGLDSPEEGHVRPQRLTMALAHGAARRGADIREGAPVEALIADGGAVRGVRLASGEQCMSDAVVLACGAWTRLCAGNVAEISVHPVLGQYVLLAALPNPLARIVYGARVYLVPRPDGTIYLGATEEPEQGYRKRVSVEGIRRLLNAATALVPDIDRAEILLTGAGLRPGSPDRSPLLGHVPGAPGLVVASGHYRNGILLSLISGRLITELLAYGRTSIDLRPFDPGRFQAERVNYADAAGSLASATAVRKP